MSKHIFYFLLLMVFITECLSHMPWLKEGSPCMDGLRQGTCRYIRDCKVKTHTSFLENPRCSSTNRQLVICCADLVTGSTSPLQNGYFDPLNPENELVKTGQKAWDKCLDYLQEVNYPCKRIARSSQRNTTAAVFDYMHNGGEIPLQVKYINGGENVLRTQFPHMALLGYGFDQRRIEWSCGGSLISDRFVLTAGHCIASQSGQEISQVALGILKRSDPQYLWNIYRVGEIYTHPDYQPPIVYNDIALLKTTERVIFSTAIAPACLAIDKPPYKRIAQRRVRVSTAGWGALGEGQKLADTLQMVYLDKLTQDYCKWLYPPNRNLPNGIDDITQVCYGDTDGKKDTCQGDSGGPIQIVGQASACQYSILAVTSHGSTCPSRGGIYTNLKPYMSWIESIVWP